MNELKNLQSFSLTTMGIAVKQAFDVLNINRMTTGIDTYGQGRCPFYLETAVIVLITDGGRLTTGNVSNKNFMINLDNIFLIAKIASSLLILLFTRSEQQNSTKK